MVMPVFNGMVFLDAAIKSIVGQTHQRLRFAIYDDHSDDGSYELAKRWADRDARITVVRGDARLGPSGSSQAAAQLASTEFVARMDADDVAHRERLAVQLAAFHDMPSAVLIGSTFEMIDGDGKVFRGPAPSRISGDSPPFNHSSIMYRRSSFDAVGGYRPGTEFFEDLDLYRRMSDQGDLAILNRPVVQVRFAGQNVRLRDDALEVLRTIDRLHTLEGLDSAIRKISPMPFYSLATLSILALQRPHLFRLMIRHVRFHPPITAMAVAVYVAIGELSPNLARSLGSALAWIRASFGRETFEPGGLYAWNFPVHP